MSDLVRQVFDLILPAVERARRLGAAFADVRAVSSTGSSLLVQDERAEKMFHSHSAGIGVRVLVDGSWGFASCDGFDRRQLEDGLEQAMALARLAAPVVADRGMVASVEPVRDEVRRLGRLEVDQISLEEKRRRCLEHERLALAAGEGKIVNSMVGYGDAVRRQWVVNTAGTQVYTELGRARLSCQVTAIEGKVRQRNFQVLGHQGGPELLLDVAPEQISVKAGRKVLEQLRAKKAPAGEFPVVFHPTISGLLAHEALGHNAEGDSVWTGQSILAGKFGEPIASPLVTIVDDSTLAGKYGSEPYDSEGVAARTRTIVKDGVLTELLHSLETAGQFQTQPNGCGRAQDHTSPPICRMSNTFFQPGESTFEEMLAGIERGIYLREGHEGYVYPERGQFLCRAHEAQMIEHGRLGEPLRDVSVSGLLVETLMNIDKVGGDFEMIFPGTCGKSGQGVPTDCGGPHLRVSKMVVGGESA
ncbi:MAG: TldD/PmbA family protein [Phycisphaerae bacterium]|nr:TldD/PmbA family protein [Phycisphaerae bacterium]